MCLPYSQYTTPRPKPNSKIDQDETELHFIPSPYPYNHTMWSCMHDGKVNFIILLTPFNKQQTMCDVRGAKLPLILTFIYINLHFHWNLYNTNILHRISKFCHNLKPLSISARHTKWLMERCNTLYISIIFLLSFLGLQAVLPSPAHPEYHPACRKRLLVGGHTCQRGSPWSSAKHVNLVSSCIFY